ncbi:MAG TPA: hypothetical protein PLU30_14240 [Verrucomicrobiae bacterium]|mgnify:CR=1 FL=1|nr:hypothetical protein [Verrucomicrobiae bacterium]
MRSCGDRAGDIALESPGAGLRAWELALVRGLIFPLWHWTTSWGEAREVFQREGQMILGECGRMDAGRLFERVLVPRLLGIEDSSRYWSAAMVLEHLMVTGKRMGEIIVALTNGRQPREVIDIKDLKPTGGAAEDVVEQFGVFLKVFEETLEERMGDPGSRLDVPHPWIGPLDGHGWACLAALHQRVHRRQVRAIRRRICASGAEG